MNNEFKINILLCIDHARYKNQRYNITYIITNYLL